MNVEKEIRIGTPHDHGNHAMSKMGSIFIGLNWEGKRTLMCLECGTTWTIEDGKAPAGYSICPLAGCNEVFKTGITSESDAQAALWSIMNLWRPFTSLGDSMIEHLGGLHDIFNGIAPLRHIYGGFNGLVEYSWEDDLNGILENIQDAKITPNTFGTELALNTIRHYVAHLWAWFEHEEEVAGTEDAIDHEAILAKATSFTDAPTLDAEAHLAEFNMVLDKIDSFEPADEAGMGLKAFFVECRDRRDALRQ